MNIIWTKTAEKTHLKNLNYLEKEWSKSTILNYIEELDATIHRITINPNLFPHYNKRKEIHKCVLNKHLTLYYQVKKNTIILLLFWNTNQNPNNIKL